jgi:Ankyrin repeat
MGLGKKKRWIVVAGMVALLLCSVAGAIGWSVQRKRAELRFKLALGLALDGEHYGISKYLEDGGDPNYQCTIPIEESEPEITYRTTLLHYAVAGSNDDVVELLLANGADPSISSGQGTPLEELLIDCANWGGFDWSKAVHTRRTAELLINYAKEHQVSILTGDGKQAMAAAMRIGDPELLKQIQSLVKNTPS